MRGYTLRVRWPSYWGWRIAGALAITQTVGYGVLFYAFGVFVVPMEAELGWTRAETAGAFSVALLLSGLPSIAVGRMVDRVGARALMTAGSVVGATLVFAWSRVTSLPGLYLVQAGIGLAMSAVLYEVAFTVLATWFRRDRIRAMTLVTVLAGLASTIFIPLATALEDAFGWRTALRVLAVVLAVVAVPLHALVLRHRPETLGLHPDGDPPAPDGGADAEPSMDLHRALRTSRFWWLSAAFAIDRVAIVAIAAHVVPLLLERGHPPALVAAVAGSIGLMQVLGRIAFVPVAERMSLTRLASLTYGTRGAALAALALVPGAAGMWTFAALFGAANGASTLARAGLVAEDFGPARYGSISGVMTTLIALAQTAAPLAVGWLYVAKGGYGTAVWILAALAAVASLVVTRGRRGTLRAAGVAS